jgi:hypothetical protein
VLMGHNIAVDEIMRESVYESRGVLAITLD